MAEESARENEESLASAVAADVPLAMLGKVEYELRGHTVRPNTRHERPSQNKFQFELGEHVHPLLNRC